MEEEAHEAISNATNLLKTLLLQPSYALLNNRINLLISMRVISGGPFRQPSNEIKTIRSVQTQWITVEQIRYESEVSIGGELVGNQLRVLPDPDHVGKEEDCGVFVDGLPCGLGDVCFDIANFDGFSGWLAAAFFLTSFLSIASMQRRP